MAKNKNTDDTTATTATNVTTAIAAPASGFGMRKLSSREDLANAFRGASMAPRFVTLENGDFICGNFVRFGRVQLGDAHKDRVTGELKSVATVVLDLGAGDRIEFLSAHELDRSLGRDPVTGLSSAVVPGDELRIARGPDERVGGQVVTRYIVGIVKAPAATVAP
jgi:hypothetical protein